MSSTFIRVPCCLVALTMCLDITTTRIASADMIVTIGDTILAPGESGYVEVMIRSDNTTGEWLGLYNMEFGLTPASGVATRLEFTGATDISGNPDYLFAGSTFFSSGVPAAPFDQVTVGDSGFALVDGADVLLARLEFSPTRASSNRRTAMCLPSNCSRLQETLSTSLQAARVPGSRHWISRADLPPTPSPAHREVSRYAIRRRFRNPRRSGPWDAWPACCWSSASGCEHAFECSQLVAIC